MASCKECRGNPDAECECTDKDDIWCGRKLNLIEYSLGTVCNDTCNIRNDKFLQKEADQTGFEATIDGLDSVSSVDLATNEDIVSSGSEDKKFVIKGGLKASDVDNDLDRIAKWINGANKNCDSACDDLKSANMVSNAWDSTVNFLKHPWTSTHTVNHGPMIDNKMESNDIVPESVNLTKNTTSSAWANSTHFVPGVANVGTALMTK